MDRATWSWISTLTLRYIQPPDQAVLNITLHLYSHLLEYIFEGPVKSLTKHRTDFSVGLRGQWAAISVWEMRSNMSKGFDTAGAAPLDNILLPHDSRRQLCQIPLLKHNSSIILLLRASPIPHLLEVVERRENDFVSPPHETHGGQQLQHQSFGSGKGEEEEKERLT